MLGTLSHGRNLQSQTGTQPILKQWSFPISMVFIPMTQFSKKKNAHYFCVFDTFSCLLYFTTFKSLGLSPLNPKNCSWFSPGTTSPTHRRRPRAKWLNASLSTLKDSSRYRNSPRKYPQCPYRSLRCSHVLPAAPSCTPEICLSKDVQQERANYQDPTIYGIGILTFLTGEVDLVHEPAKLKNPRLSPPVAKSSLMSGFVKTQIKRKKRKRCLILSIVSFIFSWSNCQEAAIHSWGTRIKKVDLGNFEHWGAVESHYHPQLQIAAPIVLLKGYPTTRASTSTSFSSKPHNQYTSQRLSVVKESCLLYHSAKKKKT